MIGNSKPTASLSSGLLARKGHARPAMRPQGFVGLSSAPHDDLGWNDMGDDTPAPAPVALSAHPAPPQAAPKPAVLRQREELDEQIAKPATEPAPSPTAAPAPVVRAKPKRAARETIDRKGKAAFTLRLDADRHLRLRLASAVHNRSAQQLVTEALDAFLESQPEVDALARQIDLGMDQG